MLSWAKVLRPTKGLLESSRAARRASLRAERLKAVAHFARAIKGLVRGLFAVLVDLFLLWTLPLLYLAAAYLALDLPARWLTHREAGGGWGVLAFIGALAIGLVGISRAVQNAAPIAPVRPQFAKAMFALSWVAALLFTLGDLVG